MIRVNETYGILLSNTDYSVVRIRTKTDKKTGKVEEYNIPLTYHDSLIKALERIAKFTVRDAVKDGDMTLSEAVTRIQTALDALTEEIENAVPDVKVVKK
jgi:succinate dehydrogenase/fumarate reductase-like Fe-S protein